MKNMIQKLKLVQKVKTKQYTIIIVNKEKLKNLFLNEIKCKTYIEKMISSILKDDENELNEYNLNDIIRKEICEETFSIFKKKYKK